jgi:hypothetical protein
MKQTMERFDRTRWHFRCVREGGVGRIVGWTFIGVFVAAFFALVFGLAVKALWNWIMPAVFGLGVITYWQAFGIIVLAKILFSGIHSPHGHDRHLPPFARARGSYDRWWREEGRAAFDEWMKGQAGGAREAGDGGR